MALSAVLAGTQEGTDGDTVRKAGYRRAAVAFASG
jgi:hypothetical protein